MDENHKVDHDLLVRLATSMDHLCAKYDKNHDEVRNDIKEIHDRIDKQAEGCKMTHATCSSFFVPRYVFYWAAVICFMAMTFVGGVAIENRADISEHKGYSIEAAKRFDDRLNRLDSKYVVPDVFDEMDEDD